MKLKLRGRLIRNKLNKLYLIVYFGEDRVFPSLTECEQDIEIKQLEMVC
jgi:hypothetical protein